ncbi:hypothetical protein OA848_03330 [Rickettsiales bacterium]|nr:hypothetical protein [Rickettsiales bacterium]
MNKVLSLLILIILVFTTNHLYDRYNALKKFNTEIWGHRGGGKYLKLPDNSPEALKKISDVGWKGIEIDCYYDLKNKRIIISHDRHLQKFRDGFFFIEEIDIPSKIPIWLDFKNLNTLNTPEVGEVNKILSVLTKKNNIYVESQSIINLFRIKKSGVKTIFNLPIYNDNMFIFFFLKLVFVILGFDFISVTHNYFAIVRNYFPANTILTFTLNNKKEICEIINNKQAFVILSQTPEKNIDCTNNN